jgi:hypothetical protein
MHRAIPVRRGFTLFQFLVVLALLVILLALLLPAIVKFRQAAARMEGSNNLKNIGLALLNCCDTHQGRMPPTIGPYPVDALRGGEGTLHFHISPFIEQPQLYMQAFDGDRYRVSFQDTAAHVIPLYLARNDPSAPPGNVHDDWLALCNYPVNYRVFEIGGKRFPASITDGTANTIFFAERYQMCNGQPHAWGYDGLYYPAPMFAYYSLDHFQTPPPPEKCDPEVPQALVPEGIQVGMGDGSVRLVSPHVSARTWWHACTPAGGEVLGSDW